MRFLCPKFKQYKWGWLASLAFAWFGVTAEGLWAQDLVPLAEVEKKSNVAEGGEKPPVVEAEVDALVVAPVERVLDFSLTEQQLASFKAKLPKAYQKLSQRKPFHMVALGDSIVEMFGYDDDKENWIKGYPARFAEQLARQFFYTGGVRIIKPSKGKPEKLQPHRGKEITLRNLGRGGKLSIHAIQALSTYGMETPPDLVLVSFGINDANTGLDLGVYARAFQDVIATVRASGGEVVLLGPTLLVGDPPEAEMAKTRAFSDTLKEVAEDSGAFYVDLADLTDLVKLPLELERPTEVFTAVVDQYRRFFDHTNAVDWVHPRPALHEVLGRKIFRELIDGPTAVPWEVGPGDLQILDNKTLELKVPIKNTAAAKTKFVALPLVTMSWKPMDATPEMELAPGESRELKIRYLRRDDAQGLSSYGMPSHEPMLRLPLLVSTGGMVRIADVRATLKPAVMLWKIETQFNLEKEYRPVNLLTNTSAELISGTWEATWMDQKLTGDYRLEAGAQQELPLKFKLPETTQGLPFNRESELLVLVKVKGQELRFRRRVDLTQNFGLKQPVPMMNQDEKTSPMLPQLGERSRSITLKADADKDTLFVTFDLRGIDLKNDPATGQSWVATLNLDARSYGKRLSRGVTDPLRISGSASDGPATVAGIQPWTFGTGYAASFDETQVKAVVSSGSEGARRITISLPRSYLYLHEWALGNGNSQVGLNATFNFWQPAVNGASAGGYLPDALHNLIYNRHRDDAEGSAVLELTAEPTQRWTVSIH